MNNKYYNKLCEKAVTGNIDESEKIQLDRWLAESEINRNKFEELKKIWKDTGPLEIPEIPDINLEWNKLNQRLEIMNSTNDNRKLFAYEIFSSLKSFLLPNWKPALVSFILFICIISGYYIISRESPKYHTKFLSTLNNEHKKIQLPDGSTVILNSGSSIKYQDPFGKNSRDVYLKGEAFFKVTKSPTPFNIYSFNAKISVLGTQFDVWARDRETRVIVKEGRVKLASINSSFKSVNLAANQISSVTGNLEPLDPKEIDSHYLLGWMNGRLVFNKTPIKEVISELERNYNIRIGLMNDSLSQNTLSGSFNNYGIDTVLSMICLALDLKYEKQPGSYLIKAKDSKN